MTPQETGEPNREVFDGRSLRCPGLTIPTLKFVEMSQADIIVLVFTDVDGDSIHKKMTIMCDVNEWTLAGPTIEDEQRMYVVAKTEQGKTALLNPGEE